MREIETISWKDLTENKYSKTLHPAMLSERGYIAQTKIRRIGDVEKTIFNVVYDRDYVVEYLEKSIFLKLRVIDLNTLIEVCLNAFINVNPSLRADDIATAFDELTNK